MRTDQVVLEANLDYWDKDRFPQVRRIIFDQTLQRKEAVELLKTSEGRVDLVTDVRPLDTLRVAQSPFGRVVKERSSLLTVLGMFNTRKAGSPWHDVRLRQAVNYAINRADFLRYAVKGNGVLVPSFLASGSFGYDPTIQPYPFAPDTARRLLQEAGHAGGFAITLIASEHLEVQATVVSKMLEQVGFTVEVQRLDPVSMFKSVNLWWFLAPYRNPRPPWPAWDIALFTNQTSSAITSAYLPGGMYRAYALYDGWYDWVSEQPEFRRLHAQISRTLDREQQRTLIQQVERHIHEQAYFLFLYSPLQVHAVNKEVRFVPRPDALLDLVDLAVTDQHWSVRKEKTAGQK